MSLEILEDELFYLDSYVVTDKKILAELNHIAKNIGLIRVWEEGYSILTQYILINSYHFTSDADIDYLHRFVTIHYPSEDLKSDLSMDEIIRLSGESIPYIYAIVGDVKKTLECINKYNLNSNDSKMFEKYFKYTKYLN